MIWSQVKAWEIPSIDHKVNIPHKDFDGNNKSFSIFP